MASAVNPVIEHAIQNALVLTERRAQEFDLVLHSIQESRHSSGRLIEQGRQLINEARGAMARADRIIKRH